MYTNLESKTREYPRIQFIDRALRKGEETHYRCFDCGQYLVSDLIHNHKCKITPLPLDIRVKVAESKKRYLSFIPIDVKVKYTETRKEYLKAEIKARKMQLNLIRELYGDKDGRNNN